ncbi:MAG: dephospho-CoA kinase [Bacillota bacterium]|jgi:dephospho-CoA kinase|nr:dephospho-CoA kinase [Bacillota bacterium]NLM07953.1 dephospho-CoA kinase [Clostridiales Family XIII bacterium]
MMIIGLTGGIGAGKTTVSDYLKKKGYPVLDADEVAREIVEPGSETLEELTRAFGKNILNSDGSLNRRFLAGIVFSDPEKKKLIDGIMHGKIIDTLLKRARSMEKEPFVFIDVPLLFETGMDRYVDQVWVVDAEEEIRIKRVMERDDSSREDVLRRIRFQAGRDEKIKKAHIILNNSGVKEILYRQIDEALNKLRENELYE